jgi:hypothetical protein
VWGSGIVRSRLGQIQRRAQDRGDPGAATGLVLGIWHLALDREFEIVRQGKSQSQATRRQVEGRSLVFVP